MLTDYSPARLRELVDSDDPPAAIAEATEAVDHFDELKADATSEEWEAIDEASELWEQDLAYLEQRHKARLGLTRARWRSETITAKRSPILARTIRRIHRPRVRARRPLRSRRVRRSNSRSSTSDPGPCRRGPCAGEGRR